VGDLIQAHDYGCNLATKAFGVHIPQPSDIVIADAYPFDIEFKLYLGTKDGTGADGVVFVLQTVGNTAIGASGDGMGYSGFSPSLGIEFDTYDNESWLGNPEIGADHTAISRNGNPLVAADILAGPVPANSGSANIEDGLDHPVRIVWEPATQLIEVYFDCELRISTNHNLIDSIFGGNPQPDKMIVMILYWSPPSLHCFSLI